MLERVIENWLDRTNERTFQVPFCHMLAAENYTVVHLTRHCAMEMGKDVIAIAPDGVPCAFQLKGAPGSKINLTRWRAEIEPQVLGLITGAIVHPSIPTRTAHRSFLVTNGEFEEEVIRAIDDLNAGFAARGQSDLFLQTIVRGQLLEKARKLETDFWPVGLPDIKIILEMYLETGDGRLPQKQFSTLMEDVFVQTENDRAPSQEEMNRAIASAGVLCSLAIASFSLKGNVCAEMEAWTIYAGYILFAAARYSLPVRIWQPQFSIAEREIYNLMIRLADELKQRPTLIEGNPTFDTLFAGVRASLLIGFMSVLALWPTPEEGDERDSDFLHQFCEQHRRKMAYWGEGTIPYWLALFWNVRRRDATATPDFLLRDLIELIATLNHPKSEHALATPYYTPETFLSNLLGLRDRPLSESFNGRSYMLEGVVHLFARRNWKQVMKGLWPEVTRVRWVRFYPDVVADFFRWRCREGVTRDIEPPHTQSWPELVEAANECEANCLTSEARLYPAFVLLYLLVCPHRANAEVLRWLDSKLLESN